MTPDTTLNTTLRSVRQPLLIIVASATLAITLLHYLTSMALLDYHTVYSSLYYLPIAGAAVAFGRWGGLGASLVVTLLYLPHVLTMGSMLPGGLIDNLLEFPIFFLVGGLVGLLADRERAQRRQREALGNYIAAVLDSLPVGVATVAPGSAPVPQNRRATELLPALPSQVDVAALAPGTHQVSHGVRPLGLALAPLSHPRADGATRVVVLEDQTEQQALEAQLRRNDRLAAVGQLAAGIAHEVRNPLAIMRAAAQLLADQLRDQPTTTRATTVLISEADRIEQLIGQLLIYARPHPPHRVPHDLVALLDQAAQAVTPYGLQHQVTIEASAAPHQQIVVDGGQFQQVLLNLLLNAIQASPPGSTVQLNGERCAERATIRVIDHGSGMAPEVRERACDPFFTTRPDGVGLGLALVASTVAAHQGHMQIEQTPGGGTTMILTIPQEETDGATLADR
jgi:signal transduction histidine kinase